MTKLVVATAGILVFVGLVGGAVIYLFGDELKFAEVPTAKEIISFEDCVAAGNAVMESYPRQCNTKDGKHFVEEIGNELQKTDLIRVHSPRPNEVITSPLHIIGEARGQWFFEASFPVRLLDANGNEILLTPSYIMTAAEWMTEDFVPFEALLEFNTAEEGVGTLYLQKDNPSGLPEYDDQLIVPVVFGSSSGNQSTCVVTGCSAHVCAEEEVFTTCEFLPEYACYIAATCERQTNGECGWTQTTELEQCLANVKEASFEAPLE